VARRFRAASLDALNFLLADVRGALGPYLNVFLVTQQRWSLGEVGLVTYNVAQGVVAIAQGIGASVSGLAGGVIVDHFGYSAGFLACAAAAAIAVGVLAAAMPETARLSDEPSPAEGAPGGGLTAPPAYHR
jgi:MFS family permease